MKHSGVHAGDLFTVMFRHNLARNAVWIRADFKLSFRVQLTLYIIAEGFTSQKSAIKCEKMFCRSLYGLFCHTNCFNVISCRQIIKLAWITNAYKIMSSVFKRTYSM